ncbi:aldo/keto reductase [Sutterella sp.]|uniref:aldo/keto reductase n=1 Tax=Sutterella sp. TaxID=1981025 RepID=UPI003FD88006
MTLARAVKVCRPASLQSEYSMMWRAPEAQIMPFLEREGIGFVPFSPLGKGFLMGTITASTELAENDFRRAVPRFEKANLEANERLVAAVRELAEEKNTAPLADRARLDPRSRAVDRADSQHDEARAAA